MRSRSALVVCALAAGVFTPARANASAGAESFDFLLIDANARAVGLGGAYTAMAADANALLYNPAGLGLVTSNEITLMHNQYFQGATQEYVAFASRSGWGASLNTLQLRGVPRTTVSQPDGSIGSLAMSDLAASVGYGRSFCGETLSLGASGKYLRESLDGLSAGGYALDAGALLSVEGVPGLTVGASLLNLGPRVRFLRDAADLPAVARAGAAYSRSFGSAGGTLAFDISKTRSDRPRMGVGAETVLGSRFALRAGFTTRNDAGLGITAGGGVKSERLAVDYAFAPYGDLGIAHRVSLTFRWGAAEQVARLTSPFARR